MLCTLPRYDLSWKLVDVHRAFAENRKTVMTVHYGAIRMNLERVSFSRFERGEKTLRREAPQGAQLRRAE